ncbi:MAG: DUF937 domain-containing protein [Aureliella sp.]
MSLLDLVSEHIGEGQVEQIANQLGASKEQTENAIGMALPTLLGAVAKKAEGDDGIAEIDQQLNGLDGSVFDQLGSLLQSDSPQSGIQALGGSGDLLGSILGGRKGRVESGIGKASGLSGGQVGSLLGMLAPLVMGAIGKRKQSDNMDLGGLSGMLRGERENIENQSKGGLLAGLLDQDGDGDFDFSDVMQMGMKRLFNR